MSALTRQKSTLFQWLAVSLWVPTGKDSVPTDSGHSGRVLLDPAARLELGARWVNSLGFAANRSAALSELRPQPFWGWWQVKHVRPLVPRVRKKGLLGITVAPFGW